MQWKKITTKGRNYFRAAVTRPAHIWLDRLVVFWPTLGCKTMQPPMQKANHQRTGSMDSRPRRGASQIAALAGLGIGLVAKGSAK